MTKIFNKSKIVHFSDIISLMSLDSSVGKLPFVGPVYVRRLEKLNIETIGDLLHHPPNRYLDYSKITKIRNARVGDTVTIVGEMSAIKNIYTKSGKKIQLANITDDSGSVDIIWFNQPFLSRTIHGRDVLSLSGKVDWYNKKPDLISTDYENIKGKTKSIHTGRLVPIYPETARVSSKWLRSRINHALGYFEKEFDEYIPEEVLKKLDLYSFKKAVKNIHFPDSLDLAEDAKKRLAFNELLFLQLKNIYRKKSWENNNPTHILETTSAIYKKFTESLEFTLTNSQQRSIKEIFSDLKKGTPMNRLLEGDVGSGKTVVAAATAFVAFINGYQSIFMAPTQILAQQHFVSLKHIFDRFKVRVSLITSAGVKADLGKTDIFVGTHALIHKKVNFDKVALVVIDEQQRFGVEQRAHLVKKSKNKSVAPHVLTMTATPIPRSIALTLYGDLDLSTLDELPKGRKKITTWLVPSKKRKGAYGWISEQIKKHSVQAFIICPLIEESQVETMRQIRAATVEFEKLQTIFPKLKLGLLHGRQKAKEKDKVMDDFKKGKIDILVSTPVVEFGIDIPNATIMLIETAERFGLAQLHQLRGRVGRGKKKSHCLLFTENYSQKAQSRLNALKKTLSGFELAELDLKLRGPGEVFGTRQHGFAELKIASWQDVELNVAARKVAEEAMKNRKKYTKLIQKLESKEIILN